jgi:hypothetical protein
MKSLDIEALTASELVDEVLQHYFSPSMAVISNIAAG